MSGDDLTGTWRTMRTTNIATMIEMMKTMMEYLAQQDATNKATNARLSVIPTAIA